MYPVLIESWRGVAIHSYGTLILIGTLMSMPGVWWDIRDRGLPAARRSLFFLDFYLVLFVGTVVGGRLLYLATAPERLLNDPTELFSLSSTGFVFFGSFLGIVLGVLWLARRYQRPFGELMDVMTTWLPLTHAFGRVGCLMAGCCYGAPWTGVGALRFPSESIAFQDPSIPHLGPTTVGLFPTQVLEAAGLLAIGAALWWRRRRLGPRRPWDQTIHYSLAYGTLRLSVELFRGDADRRFLAEWTWPAAARKLGLAQEHVFGLSTSQAGALALVGLALFALWRRRRGIRRSGS